MSNKKYTEGKWKVKDHICERKWVNIESNKGIIARSFYGVEKPIVTENEAKANAKLISKAPEMLEMLEETLNEWGTDNYIGTYHYEKIKQLIKEATEI